MNIERKRFNFLYFFNNISYNIIVRGGTMLHLNNHGWGLSVLLAFLLVFFIAIILISIGASNLGLN